MSKTERTLKLFEFDRGFVSQIKSGQIDGGQIAEVSARGQGHDLLDAPDFDIEKCDLGEERPVFIGGCDEAGRGPLAGPLVCAACVMPLGDGEMIDGIFDSKGLTEPRRESLFQQIMERAIGFSVSVIDCETIDEINILNATKLGMRRVIDGLVERVGERVDVVLVDAVSVGTKCKTVPLIKGDAKSYNIAAASIIAKVTRDRIMRELGGEHPAYCFGKNKGYGTAEHIGALKEHGACSQHRKTFVKNFVADMLKK